MKNDEKCRFNRLRIAFLIFLNFLKVFLVGIHDEVLRPGLPSATHANESTDAESVRAQHRCWDRKTMGKSMVIDSFIGVEHG